MNEPTDELHSRPGRAGPPATAEVGYYVHQTSQEVSAKLSSLLIDLTAQYFQRQETIASRFWELMIKIQPSL